LKRIFIEFKAGRGRKWTEEQNIFIEFLIIAENKRGGRESGARM
jgi:hypothetical protein